MAVRSTEGSEKETFDALRRLLAAATPLRPFAKGREPGLFASKTNATNRLLDSLLARELVAWDPGGPEPVCRLTDAGREHLLREEDPQQLLEDLLRAQEAACERLAAIESESIRMREELQLRSQSIQHVLVRLKGRKESLQAEVMVDAALRDFESGPVPVACTLADLFVHLAQRVPGLSIGQFHDMIRSLHEAGYLRLTPWTGPLYQLPEPALALLIGHEVLYYVARSRIAAA